MVKFYKKGYFIAKKGTKTGNKQQKHDLVNCPLFLKKAATPPPEIGIFENFKKIERDPPWWPFNTIIMDVHALKKISHGRTGTQVQFSKSKKKRWSYWVWPPLSTKSGQILWKRPFYNMIRPKNVQKQEKHDFVICPPILKNFQNVKIDKSISAL